MDVLTLLLAIILGGLAVTGLGYLFGIGFVLADAARMSPMLALRIVAIGGGLFMGLVLLLYGTPLGLYLIAGAIWLAFRPWNFGAP